ncbi:MAG: dynamin family protein [Anaerolineae bacterium]|nr:dynamin family protein [Anaerolineae bacterium]MCA9893356.1 dynamin family protein [Anaerolineae bacterium]
MTTTLIEEGPMEAYREKAITLVNDIATSLADMGDHAANDRKRLRDVAQDLTEMFFMVAVIGEFNAGKSTFINAILGDRLLPTGITPTTEYIELIRYNEQPQRVPVVREDGLREWAHPNTGAEGVAIVDTPGTGSVFARHEKIAKDFLHRSDLVIFVISAKRAFAETERMYLELAKNYGKKIILVINQIDLLDEGQQQEVRRFIDNQVKQLLNLDPLIFMVSAKNALEVAESEPNSTGDAHGLAAVRAHLRGLYHESPPARQKLISQLDTALQLVRKYKTESQQHSDVVNLDVIKVRDVERELEQQSMGLEARMRDAGENIRDVLEGVRRRGLTFIEANLNIRRIGRGINREELQAEFDEAVIGRSLQDINDNARDYVNAVIDQSRLYWRGVIDRLNKLQDLMEQEVGGLDTAIYSEQRESLQQAIRIAEAELKSYSSGRVVNDLQTVFTNNLNSFQGSALFTLGGIVTMVVAVATPGGLAAFPLVMPALVIGAAVTAVFSVPMLRYLRKVARDTKDTFNTKVDGLIQNYEKALDELTQKERIRLNQYGTQILTPIFSRLDVLSRRYVEQKATFTEFEEAIKALKAEIEAGA